MQNLHREVTHLGQSKQETKSSGHPQKLPFSWAGVHVAGLLPGSGVSDHRQESCSIDAINQELLNGQTLPILEKGEAGCVVAMPLITEWSGSLWRDTAQWSLPLDLDCSREGGHLWALHLPSWSLPGLPTLLTPRDAIACRHGDLEGEEADELSVWRG